MLEKRIAILLAMALFCVADLKAGNLSSEKTQVWRSTETSTADTDVSVATAAIYLYRLFVTSSTSLSEFQYFNSSAAVGPGVQRSTSSVYSLGVTGANFELREVLDRGFRYTKTGNASIRVLWDWVVNPPQGQSGRGLK